MGLFALLRFLTPNNGVSVSEAGGDLSTTAALGQAVENFDTYATRNHGSNTATAAMTLDLSLASVTTGLKVPAAAGAAPLVDGAEAVDTTSHARVRGRNGSKATYAELETAQVFSANQVFGALWSDAPAVIVASAATFALPATGNNVNVTGTTTITDFTGPATNGVVYRLQFTDASPTGITSGNHAKLNGSFAPAQNNFIFLFWDGTNAYEVGRYTGVGAATGLTTANVTATASVTMTSANTAYDMVSMSCAAGTWVFVCSGAITNTAGGTNASHTMRIQSSTGTVYAENETYLSSTIAGDLGNFAVTPPIVLGSTTTVKASALSRVAGCTLQPTVSDSGTANKGYNLVGLKVA